MKVILGYIIIFAIILFIVAIVVITCAAFLKKENEERPDDPRHCSRCGKEIDEVKPCPYNFYHYYSCDECCEECWKYEPFKCDEYKYRKKEKQ